jgi:hypothetical protein
MDKVEEFTPTVYGVGYLGVGKHQTQLNGVRSKIYYAWNNILERCYSKRLQIRKSTYIGTTIYKEWECFQTFAKWYQENYIEDFQLDKDILVKGNKVYGPETCCFVPREINNLFTNRKAERGNLPLGVGEFNGKYRASLSVAGVSTYLGTFKNPKEAFQRYKTAKEFHIKVIAEKWKSIIAQNVYQTLVNYEVEITD